MIAFHTFVWHRQRLTSNIQYKIRKSKMRLDGFYLYSIHPLVSFHVVR